jgi:SacI-like restriction endonuclease
MKVDKAAAARIVREEVARPGKPDRAWTEKVEELSRLCDESGVRTHIAFFGTAVLAKAVNVGVDLYAIKPSGARKKASAYSARTLCHSALVPLAAELGFSLGVTGREPLNNQPYFRMKRLNDGTPIHANSKIPFDFMLGLIDEVEALKTTAAARKVLRAFLVVRSKHQRHYAGHGEVAKLNGEQLAASISQFVKADSEGGRRAQATVAGLFDVFSGVERVVSGRINDPSRKYPGDVCVRARAETKKWERAIEVRDKRVSLSDVQIFGKKCVDMGVSEAAVVMSAENQERLDEASLASWCAKFGIGVTLFYSWNELVRQVLFWSDKPQSEAAIEVAHRIYERLKDVEASTKAVDDWQKLLRASER